MESNGDLDRMIDTALAGYSSAQPLEGLEERVLNRVRLSARRRVIGWAVAMAVVASVVVAAIFVRIPRAAVPAGQDVARVQTPAPPRLVPETLRIAPKQRRGRIVTKRAEPPRPLPRLEQFPSPTPMTTEERALLAFVEHHPDEAKQLVTQQQKSGEPIEIQPIQIAPLQSDGAQ
ncbi:MAG TPA: hypothetical protein VMT32_09165 [Bryobacteraceae bacterium]|nr:hypothetical protein [Bryobacteraceae bacterium]